MKRITKQLRKEILELYLRDPQAGTKLAMDHGLTAPYAYKLANALGVLPLTRHPSREANRNGCPNEAANTEERGSNAA